MRWLGTIYGLVMGGTSEAASSKPRVISAITASGPNQQTRGYDWLCNRAVISYSALLRLLVNLATAFVQTNRGWRLTCLMAHGHLIDLPALRLLTHC